MKKEIKIKLLSSFFMIMLTGSILTVSTYAWFTANEKANLDKIDVNVSSTNGLQISVNGTDWKSSISTEDINGAKTNKYEAAVNQIPSLTNALAPISTAGEVDPNTGFLKFYNGIVDNNPDGEGYIITSTASVPEENGTTGKYIAFDLFFQVTLQSQIYLTKEANVVYRDASESRPENGIQNAARVAFVPQGNAVSGSSLETIQALKATDNMGWKLWEPNYDTHTLPAVINALQNYNEQTTMTGANRITYYAINSQISAESKLPTSSHDENFLKLMTPDITSPAAGFSNNERAFILESGITKVRIYMWIEGQDVDCENKAAGGTISYNLTFTIL